MVQVVVERVPMVQLELLAEKPYRGTPIIIT